MKQYQIRYNDEADFSLQLENLKCTCDPGASSGLTFYINWSSGEYSDLKRIIAQIEKHYPGALYYGNEASGNICDGDLSYGIAVTCFKFEDPGTKVELVWVEAGSELSSLEDLWLYCKSVPDLKAVELIPSSSYLNKLDVDGSVIDLPEDVLVFGGASVNHIDRTKDAAVFASGHPLNTEGMVAVLYSGNDLYFLATYVTGWKGLGRYLPVTASDGTIVREIEGSPAYSIYEKYLNLTMSDTDTLIFPLIEEEDGTEFIRTPIAILPDKSMQMFFRIPVGTHVRIAYGDKNTILQSLYDKAYEISAFKPEAIKAFSCAGRKIFWGDKEISKETSVLQEVASVCGFYTGGEIFRFGNKLRALNQTLCIASIRENEVSGDIRRPSPRKEKALDKSLVSRLTYFIEQVSQEEEQANHSKTDFLFNMSHDIRTPMNAISGFTAMAKKHVDDKEKVLDYLEKIDISSQQLLMLINQVLEMSRIESGKVELEEKAVSIRKSHQALVTVLSEQARAHGLEFHSSLCDILHDSVLADEGRMSQITLNITSNAIKYTPSGGRVDFIFRENPCDREGYGNYSFIVSDTGIGMSEDFQKVLFEPFSREKNSTVSHIQGTGLGLSIVKNLVDILGGTINVHSVSGKGTRFEITLDLKLSDETVSPDLSAAEEKARSFEGFRVLLVEDNKLNREIARCLLEDQGFVVEEAEDGDVAVERMKEIAANEDWNHFVAVLMDVQMPRMNGFEATRQIRAISAPIGVHVPIIALSANAFEEDKVKSLAAGMDDHIAKPINIELLCETLNKYIF